MTTFHCKEFYTASEMLKKAGGRLTRRMFEHLRNTLKIIPPPIKQSRGKGMIALYPESTLRHLQQILLEQANGLTFREVQEKLKNETREVFEEAQFWREEFNIQPIPIEEFLRRADQPASVFKIDVEKKTKERSKRKSEIQKFQKELKRLCRSWDGKSMDDLKAIKEMIESLERVKVSERVFMEVKSQ